MRAHLALRRRALLGLASALTVLALAACNGPGPVGTAPAARVNGHDISVRSVFDLLEAQHRNLKLQKAEADASGQGDPSILLGQTLHGSDSWDMASFTGTLQEMIQYRLIQQVLEQEGGTVTKADRDQARQALVQQLGDEATLKKRDQVLIQFAIDENATSNAVLRVMARKAGPEAKARHEAELRQLYQQNIGQYRQVCLSGLLAKDEAAANDAKARVQGGEPFATVAKDVSTDAQNAANGGEIPCAPEANVQSSLGIDPTGLKAGDFVGPIDAGNGTFALFQVRALQNQSFDDVRDQLEQQSSKVGTAEAQAALTKAIRKAKVSIDPRYGRWNASRGTIDAPVGATTTTTSTPAPTASAPVG